MKSLTLATPRVGMPLFMLGLWAIPCAGQGGCVALHCAKQLFECQIDTVCRTWSSCNQKCGLTNLTCQMRCADLYKPTNASAHRINEFSECVISEHHCVKQAVQNCPVPANAKGKATAFDLGLFNGQWYVTKGLNPTYDCFDCQTPTFTVGAGDVKPLHGALKYRVKTDLNCAYPDCEYLVRDVHQNWAPDASNSWHLINHNNSLEELHYADDWYVLTAKDDAYILVYYCGCNDAICGYAGAVLFTRAPALSGLTSSDIAMIRSAVSAAGVSGFDYDTMCTPDNRACADKLSTFSAWI